MVTWRTHKSAVTNCKGKEMLCMALSSQRLKKGSEYEIAISYPEYLLENEEVEMVSCEESK